MKWTRTGKPFVWYWLKNWGWEKFVSKWCLGISQSNSRMRGWAQFLTSKCITVRPQPPYLPDLSPCDSFLFQKVKLAVKGQHFEHPEVLNAGLQRHSTNCVPGMLQRVASPLEKVRAGTRDVLWRWPHCRWWINKIKLLLEPIPLLYCQISYSGRFAAVFVWLCAVCSFINKIKWTRFWARNTDKFLFFGRLGLRLSELRPLMRPLSISRMTDDWVWRTVRMKELRKQHWITQKYVSHCHSLQIQNPIKIVVEVKRGFWGKNSATSTEAIVGEKWKKA